MAEDEALKFWPATDVGRVREHNEDSFLVDKKLKRFVVCDGMGGHAAGEVASSMAARAIRDAIEDADRPLDANEVLAAAQDDADGLGVCGDDECDAGGA